MSAIGVAERIAEERGELRLDGVGLVRLLQDRDLLLRDVREDERVRHAVGQPLQEEGLNCCKKITR